jgi:ribonuclease-3
MTTLIAEISLKDLTRDFSKLFKALEYNFKNPELLEQSLTHSSYSHEKGIDFPSNERLEFLGDSVLSTIVTEILFEKFPEDDEGILSKMRSFIVSEDSLKQIALFLELDKYLLLGVGEQRNNGRARARTLCCVFEAVMGAMFLEAGFSQTQKVYKNIFERFERKHFSLFDKKVLDFFDPKSRLQVEVLKHYQTLPEYQSEDLEDQFKVSLLINGEVVASEVGDSKKVLEKKLAKKYLQQVSKS